MITQIVAICDDEIEINGDLESKLIKIFKNLKMNYTIDVYATTEELYQKMSNGVYYDLIFLDIEFAQQERNGIEIGQLIRSNYNTRNFQIIYISWHEKYAMHLFDTRPFNFLIKPIKEERLEEVLTTYLQLIQPHQSDFTYKVGHDVFKIQNKDIIYLESNKKKIVLHLVDGEEEFYGSLKNVYKEQLEQFDFLHIHAKYVVNYDHISSISYEELTLSSGQVLPISHPRKQEVRKDYSAIMRKRRRV